MLNYEFPPIGGGAGYAHLNILKEYARRTDLTIDVLTAAPQPGYLEENLSQNITIYKIGLHKKNLHYWRKTEVIEWLAKAYFRYRQILQRRRYDLVHAFFAFPTGWLCYRTADKLPYIISLRGSDVPGYNIRLSLDYKLMSGLFRKIWSSATVIVANSVGLRNLAVQFMPELNIEVIPNGINSEQFFPLENKTISKTVKLLTVCRLITRKRIDLLITAVSRAKELGLDTQLNIAGEGNLMPQLQRLAGELNVADSVTFMGRVPAEQMPQLYRDNDIFVMSSAHEGMSNAMLEAMASGLPIVTTRCEGVQELIADNGIVVEKADAKSIADAVMKLVRDKQMYNMMCIAARKQAENFSWRRVAEEYLKHYQNIKNISTPVVAGTDK